MSSESVQWGGASEHIPDQTIVADARLTNYLAASAITILIADYLATIHEEVDFVWNKRWSVPSILYLWNRYTTAIAVSFCATVLFKEMISNNICRSFIVGEGVVSTFLVVSFDLMLVFRVWILYGKKRRMSYVLCAVLLAELVSMLIILLLSAPYLHDFVHLGHVLPGCYFIAPVGRGPYFAVYALPPLLVTFAMFILTVYKCSKTLYQEKSTEMPIITLFLRDGIVWFLIVFGVDGLQMLVWATGRATLTQVLIIPSLVLHSLVASRVLLNIRSLPGLGVLEDGQEAERLLPGAGSWGA